MSNAMNRVMVSIPSDVENEIEELKKSQFYDKPYSELYRQVLRCGIGFLKAEHQNQPPSDSQQVQATGNF